MPKGPLEVVIIYLGGYVSDGESNYRNSTRTRTRSIVEKGTRLSGNIS